MREKFPAWWQQIKTHRVANVLVALLAVVIVLSILGYIFNWDWTGLGPYIGPPHSKDSVFQRGKTLWDWLQLLIIPLALAIIAILFNRSERKNEQRIASDNQQEAALVEYIKEMSVLLLERNLRESQPNAEVRTIARVRTLTALSRLDKKRKGSVLQFLHESGLIDKDKRIIALRGADLSEADLRGVNLHGDHLGGVDLRKAGLRKADLSEITTHDETMVVFSARMGGYTRADLRGADLREAELGGADLSSALLDGANLSEASLHAADLSGVDLRGVDLHGTSLRAANMYEGHITPEQEKIVSSLKRAIMPDGTKHP